jgi:hypothetical protein
VISGYWRLQFSYLTLMAEVQRGRVHRRSPGSITGSRGRTQVFSTARVFATFCLKLRAGKQAKAGQFAKRRIMPMHFGPTKYLVKTKEKQVPEPT